MNDVEGFLTITKDSLEKDYKIHMYGNKEFLLNCIGQLVKIFKEEYIDKGDKKEDE